VSPFSRETIKILSVGLFVMPTGYFKFGDLSPIISMIITTLEILLAYLIFSVILKAGQKEFSWIREKIKKSGS
jgi:surface polysaccharide O-acyltransferase-like enzyme